MTPRALLVPVALLALAACGDQGDSGTLPLADFVVTAPDGFVELVPTTTVELAWQVTPSTAFGLELDVVAGAAPPRPITTQALASGTFTWDGRDLARTAVPPDNYQLRAVALGPDDGEVDTADGDNAHLIVVQGVTFRDAALTFTGGQAARELVLTTVARSTIELALVADPDPAIAGDELPLLTASIPGELVPRPRSYPFTGRTADDRAIAAGTYVLAAVVRARAGAITYRVDGPTLTWTP